MNKEQNYDRTGLNDYFCLETKSVVILESKALALSEWYQVPKAKALDSITTFNNDT